MNNAFLSAEDFKGGRLNMSIFTNLEKSHTPETLEAEFGEHTIINKAIIGSFVEDVYKITGGEIIKGGFNDTPEVFAVLEKAKEQFASLIPIRLEGENGIEDAFIIKVKADGEDDLLEKGKDNELEKGKISNAFEYSNNIVFKKTGAEIGAKMIGQIAKSEASIINLETELSNLADAISNTPTQSPYGGRFDVKCPYKNFHWCLTDYVGESGGNLNQPCVAENGNQLYPSATQEEAEQYRKWNDLVYKWIDEQKELALIRLFSNNFDEKEKYELSAEQMIALGF